MRIISWLGLACSVCCFSAAIAAPLPAWEVTAAYGNGDVLPTDQSRGIQEYRAGLGYFPLQWRWHGVEPGFEVSFAHLVAHDQSPSNLNVAAVVPVVRWAWLANSEVSPYVEGGAGPGLLSAQHFAGRNLSLYFTFADFAGVGAVVNGTYPWEVGVNIMHYSNAGLGRDNPGVTIPVVGYVGMRF